MIVKELKGEYCNITLRSDDVLEITTFKDVEYDDSQTASVIRDVLSITEGKHYYVLVLSGQYSNVTVESMQLLASPQAMSYALAKAYVISSPAQRLMANFFLANLKQDKPVKFFLSQEKAEEWITSLKSAG